MFLTFAFNTLGNASSNLLAIVSITACLAILAWLLNRIYENVFNDFLETAYLLNLCILAAGTYHVKEIGGNQAGLAYTSVGIAFIFFVCIVLYHVYLRLHKFALWELMPKLDIGKCATFILGHNKENDDEDEVENGIKDTEIVQAPTSTTIELHESMLGN